MKEQKKIPEAFSQKTLLKLFQTSIENSLEAVLWTDQDGFFLFANQKASCILGYSIEEILEMSVFDISPDLDQEKWRLFWEKLRLNQAVQIETAHRKKDQKMIPIQIHAHYFREEEEEINFAFIKDISLEKNLKTELQKKEKTLHEFSEILPEIVYECDLEGNLTYINSNAYQKLGYSQEDFSGKVNVYSIIPDQYHLEIKKNIEYNIQNQSSRGNEYEIIKKDGTLLPVMIHSSIVYENELPVGLRGIVIDVSEKKKQVEALKEREESFRDLAENTMDLVIRFDLDRIVIYANPIVEKISGKSFHNLIGKKINEISFLKESAEKLEQTILSVFETKILKRIQMFINRSYWLDCFFIPEFSASNEIKSVLFSGRDISDYKTIETALRESEEEFRSLFEESGIAIAVSDTEGNFLNVNPAFVGLFGYSGREFYKMNLKELKKSNDLDDEEEKGVQKLIAGTLSSFQIERKVYDKNSSEKWVLINISLIRWLEGTPKHFIVQMQDITRQKKAEEKKSQIYEIQKNVNKILSFINNLGFDDFNFAQILEKISRAFQINHLALYIFQKDETEILFKKAESAGSEIRYPENIEINSFSKNERDAMKKILFIYQNAKLPKILQSILKNLKSRCFYSFPLILGESFYGIFLVPGKTGCLKKHIRNFLSIVVQALASDWKRKKDYEKIQEIEREKLIQEKLLLKTEKLAALGTLASSINHEINQPLQSIKMMTASTLYWHEQHKDYPYEKVMDYFKKISHTVDRISEIIEHMRISYKSKGELKLETVDVNQIITKTKEFLSQKLMLHQINIQLNLEKNLSKIIFSEIQFQQILINLIDNAVNSLDKEKKSGKKIEIKSFENDEKIIIQISDNGSGIEKDYLEKIFDPFFTTNPKEESSGMGLYIVYNILSSYNAIIKASNQLPQGAVFTIELNKEKGEK